MIMLPKLVCPAGNYPPWYIQEFWYDPFQFRIRTMHDKLQLTKRQWLFA